MENKKYTENVVKEWKIYFNTKLLPIGNFDIVNCKLIKVNITKNFKNAFVRIINKIIGFNNHFYKVSFKLGDIEITESIDGSYEGRKIDLSIHKLNEIVVKRIASELYKKYVDDGLERWK